MKDLKKVVGYCRVSTDNQKEEGTISLQVEALKDYASKKKYDLVSIFEDEGVSGGLADREALSELFIYLEDKENHSDIEGVLIYKLDRLARDLYIQETIINKLEKLGKELISTKEPDLASNDPMRKAFRQFMGIVAELEKAFITMRLSGGRINKIKNKGKYAGGGKALGYGLKSSDLIVDNHQAQTIRRIFKLRWYSHKSLGSIAKELNEENVSTARGGKWYAGTIKYILDNQIYRGTLEYSGQEAKRADLVILPTIEIGKPYKR